MYLLDDARSFYLPLLLVQITLHRKKLPYKYVSKLKSSILNYTIKNIQVLYYVYQFWLLTHPYRKL
jgi:hypothetical protein